MSTLAPPRRARGRPKAARNRRTLVREIAMELHPLETGGVRRVVTTMEYVIYAMRSKMMQGDLKAQRVLEDLIESLGGGESHGVLMAPEIASAAQWIKNQEETNACRVAPTPVGDDNG